MQVFFSGGLALLAGFPNQMLFVLLGGGREGSLLSIYAAKQKIGLFTTHAQQAAKD